LRGEERGRRAQLTRTKAQVGLFVSKLSTSSVRYEIGVFREHHPECCAHGHFVHVFVDPQSRRPVPIPEKIRAVIERELLVPARSPRAAAAAL